MIVRVWRRISMTHVAKRAQLLRLLLAAAVLVLLGGTGVARDRYDRHVDIVNETGRVIYSFYSTNKGVSHWGRDLLGQNVIQPGQGTRINLDDRTGYCVFDFRAVLDNGRVIERYRVDVCTVGTWRVQ
jgi:hypothetical protein